jgi:hypothetical protein
MCCQTRLRGQALKVGIATMVFELSKPVPAAAPQFALTEDRFVAVLKKVTRKGEGDVVEYVK